LLCSSTAALGADHFVNNVTGDDRRNGSQPKVSSENDGPFRTIGRGLRAAQSGDRVVIANTGINYRESITLQAGRHSGIPTQPFRVVGNGAILDGTSSIHPRVWKFVKEGEYRYRTPRFNYEMLYVEGKPGNRVPASRNKPRPKLEPLQWCHHNGYMYFRVEDGKTPEDYDLAQTGLTVGVTLYEVRHILISDLIVQGFQLDGFNAHEGVFGLRMLGVTARGNGRSGISIGGASRVTLDACLSGNNGAAQLRTEGFSKTELMNKTDLIDNTAPRIVHRGGEIIENGMRWRPPADDEPEQPGDGPDDGRGDGPDEGQPKKTATARRAKRDLFETR
jgi:hypothetical protein